MITGTENLKTRAELPDKLFFKIGEVSKLIGVKQHVLRYWESEFPIIRPQKSKTNQRLYRRKDVEAVIAIKHLLYDRKFTIEGARRHIKDEGVEAVMPPPDPATIVAATKKEALKELDAEVNRAKGSTADWYEKKLVALKLAAQNFIKDIDDND